MAIGVAFLACTLPVGLAAQTSSADTDRKVADLEKQLQAIRAELDAIKSAPAPAAAVATPQASAAPANPLSGITSVLGGVSLTGLVDAYYGYNANHPALGVANVGNTANEPFQFTNSQFSLNLLELQLDKPVDKTSPLGFRVALGFGQAINAVNNTGSDVSSSLPGVQQYLKEGYLSYMAPIGKGLQIDAGKFVTPAGVEVIESNQNWNYSRGLLFYDAVPYYHFGVRAKYTFNGKWSVTGLATNGWNNVVSTNTGKTGGFSLAWNATKKLTLTETYLAGPRDPLGLGDNGPWNHLADTVLAYNPTAKLSVAAEFDYDHQGVDSQIQARLGLPSNITGADYTGFAGFVKYAVTPKVAVAARYEYLNDHDGLAMGINGALPAPTSQLIHDHPQEFTGTLERTFGGHLISRLEYRHDYSNNNIFQRGGGAKGSASFVGGQDTVDVGLMFVLQPTQ
jgi:hypothetical protein